MENDNPINDCNPHPRAGAAAADISPTKSVFLFGYPNVPRMSTSIHDPILASALFLDDGKNSCLLISVDLIGLTRHQVATARQRISRKVSVRPENILIAASHTHSGPLTFQMVSNAHDPIVPPLDSDTIEKILHGIAIAAEKAVQNAQSAEIGLVDATVTGIGGNRHDPNGPTSPIVPVLIVRSAQTKQLLALQYVFSVHPTVLHEDSTLISGDFPGVARQFLQNRLANGRAIPVLNHLGAAGNQSPRHAVQANTLAEATRLGQRLGEAIGHAATSVEYISDWMLEIKRRAIELPLRSFPSLDEAGQHLVTAQLRIRQLKHSGADRAALRTAECDLFGAEEMVALADAAKNGRLDAAAHACMPAEIQTIRIHSRLFVAWPGEVFIEFAMAIQRQFPNAVVITLANGELQGYLVTAEAVENAWYEASNALFSSPESGDLLVTATEELLTGEAPPARVAQASSQIT